MARHLSLEELQELGDHALATGCGILKAIVIRPRPTRASHAAVRTQPGRRRARRQLGQGLLDVAARWPAASRRAGDDHERAYDRADPPRKALSRSPGQSVIDLDLSDESAAGNPPLGRLRAARDRRGAAQGCKKFAGRYGADAALRQFKDGLRLDLRGIARIVERGMVTVGDTVT